MRSFIFPALVFFTTLLCCAMGFFSRGITFINVGKKVDGKGGMTDAEKQVLAASHSHLWKWPSDMHRYAGEKARMKDVGVLGVAVMQRIFRNTKDFYPLMMLCNIAMGVSAILLYLVAENYWGVQVGLLGYALFVGCFWPYQITLTGGYHCIALALLLASVLSLQYGWNLVAGVLLGFMMFASASGRKFIGFFIGAFLWSQRDFMNPLGFLNGNVPRSFLYWLIVSLSFGLLLFVAIRFGYAKAVTAIYSSRRSRFLNSLLVSKSQHSLERYLQMRGMVLKIFFKLFSLSFALLLLSLFVSGEKSFYIAEFSLLFGFLLAVWILTAPNVISNLRGYFNYWYLPKNSCHFILYRDFFKKIGKPISDGMRGAGLKWIWLFQWRFLPFHALLCCVAVVLIGITIFSQSLDIKQAFSVLGILFLGSSPVIFGELTLSPQFARPYFPILPGMLLITLYGLHVFAQILPTAFLAYFWSCIWFYTLLSGAYNFWILVTDVFPCRMTLSSLDRVLTGIGVKKIYTYDTPHNDALMHSLPSTMSDKYDLCYIRSLKEVKEGYVVVPGTSAKSLNIESYREGIEGKDFDEDSLLSKLIETHEIEKFAVARFKTYGTSKVWVHDSEMPTYRELILKDITDADRWRGFAWLLDAKRLAAMA